MPQQPANTLELPKNAGVNQLQVVERKGVFVEQMGAAGQAGLGGEQKHILAVVELDLFITPDFGPHDIEATQSVIGKQGDPI